MKKYKSSWILLIVLTLVLIPSTFGFMNLISQFSNGLPAENLTFTGNQNITRYANVSVDVTDAYLNLSGIERFSYIRKYDALAIGCKTQHFAASIYGIAANDTTMFVLCYDSTDTSYNSVMMYDINGVNVRNWSFYVKGGYSEAGGISYDSGYIYINNQTERLNKWTSEGTYQSGVSFNAGDTLRGLVVRDNKVFVHDGTSYLIREFDLTGTQQASWSSENPIATPSYDGIAKKGGNLYLLNGLGGKQVTKQSLAGDFQGYNEVLMNITAGNTYASFAEWNDRYYTIDTATGTVYVFSNYPFNVSLGNNSIKEFSYTGMFNQTNNRTSNFASSINSAFNNGLCNCDGCILYLNNCSIPLVFHSDTSGTLQVSSIYIRDIPQASHWASSYNAVEGQDVNFTLQINATSIVSTNATFYFNNTAYNFDTRENSSTQANFTKTLSIPSIVLASENQSFYWNYTINSFNNITDTKNLTVNKAGLSVNGTCPSGLSAAFNFTFADEENFSSLTESITYNFKYGFVNNTQFISFGSLSNISSFQLCINSTVSNNYSLGYGEIAYQKSGYAERRYYIMQNQRATNITGNIVLYSLDNSFATSFLFNAKDSALNPYSNYYLALLRWYPDNDTYNIVEMGKTNDNGQTVMKVHSDIVDYRVALYKIDGTLIKLANASRISCIETPCTYNLVVYGAESDYISLYNIQSSVTKPYSDTLRFIWNDPSQLTDSMTFYVYQDNGYTETSICNDTSNNYIGVLSCNFSGYTGLIGYKCYRTASPLRPIISGFFEIRDRLNSAFGLIIQFCISMILGFIGLFSPIAAISMGIVSLVIGWAIGTISFQIMVSVAIIGGIIIHFIGRSQGK